MTLIHVYSNDIQSLRAVSDWAAIKCFIRWKITVKGPGESTITGTVEKVETVRGQVFIHLSIDPVGTFIIRSDRISNLDTHSIKLAS